MVFISVLLLDNFFIGQLFNDYRNETYGVAMEDTIDTTLTTKGYLSNGCSHPITVNGGKKIFALEVG